MFQAIHNESMEVEGVRTLAHTFVAAPAATPAALDTVGVEAPLGLHALLVPEGSLATPKIFIYRVGAKSDKKNISLFLNAI